LAGEERAREIIRDALARALFDAPPEVLDDLASTALEGRARRCNGPVLLARRIAAELAHAGWVLKSARDCPVGAGAVQRRLALEDHIHFGITSAEHASRAAMMSADHAAAYAARGAFAGKIHETLNLMRVVLGKPAAG